MIAKTYQEATALLPADARWSSCFGNPGDGGYCEYFRTKAGERFTISNGDYNAFAPFTWTVAKVEERTR